MNGWKIGGLLCTVIAAGAIALIAFEYNEALAFRDAARIGHINCLERSNIFVSEEIRQKACSIKDTQDSMNELKDLIKNLI